MKLNRKSLHAMFNLSNRFWAHVFRRTFFKPKPGEELKKFRKNYEADRLVPLTPLESSILPEYQKCINCGACSSVCPVYPPAEAGFYRGPDSITAALSRSFPDYGAARDAIYNCTQCGACAAACTRGIDIPELVLMVRRKSVEIADPGLLKQYDGIVGNVAMTGNIYGECGDGFDAYKQEKAECVYLIGCTGRHRTRDATLKTLDLLKALGVDFTVIDEKCCGGFHRAVGIDPGSNQGVRENIENIVVTGAKKIITGCPHCYETMKRCDPYKKTFREKGIVVEHVSTFLSGIDFEVEKNNLSVAYHDPCFLGRRNGIYDAPRELIGRLGVARVELTNNRDESLCCGSKDGTFIIDVKVSGALVDKRMRQVEESGAEVLLTECPACLSAFRNTGNDGIRIDTVAGYLADRLKR